MTTGFDTVQPGSEITGGAGWQQLEVRVVVLMVTTETNKVVIVLSRLHTVNTKSIHHMQHHQHISAF